MSQRFDYPQTIPSAMHGFAAVHQAIGQSGLPPALLELVYLRVSQINGCAFCIDMHGRAFLKLGLSIDRLLLVGVWQECGTLFDDKERAALAWAETVTRLPHGDVPDAAYQAGKAEFNDQELAALTAAIALMNAYNRLSISARNLPAAAQAAN